MMDIFYVHVYRGQAYVRGNKPDEYLGYERIGTGFPTDGKVAEIVRNRGGSYAEVQKRRYLTAAEAEAIPPHAGPGSMRSYVQNDTVPMPTHVPIDDIPTVYYGTTIMTGPNFHAILKSLKVIQSDLKWLVIAITQPNGSIELITNGAQNIEAKLDYYLYAYDEKGRSRHSPTKIKINSIMAV